jgi:hypothetical protein
LAADGNIVGGEWAKHTRTAGEDGIGPHASCAQPTAGHPRQHLFMLVQTRKFQPFDVMKNWETLNDDTIATVQS